MFGNELVTVKQGSFITSIRNLWEFWGWSNSKTVGFLIAPQNDKIIVYKSDTKKTVISIVNYSSYQQSNLEKRQKNDTEATQKHTNNNDNNDNNIYGEFENVLLSNDEYKKLEPLQPLYQ